MSSKSWFHLLSSLGLVVFVAGGLIMHNVVTAWIGMLVVVRCL